MSKMNTSSAYDVADFENMMSLDTAIKSSVPTRWERKAKQAGGELQRGWWIELGQGYRSSRHRLLFDIAFQVFIGPAEFVTGFPAHFIGHQCAFQDAFGAQVRALGYQPPGSVRIGFDQGFGSIFESLAVKVPLRHGGPESGGWVGG